MKDKQVFISKTDVGGEEVTGAYMQIIDENGMSLMSGIAKVNLILLTA